MAVGDTQRDKINVFPSDLKKEAISQGNIILAKGYRSQRDNAIECQLFLSWN